MLNDKSKKKAANHTKIISVSIVVMGLGYYMLNYIATWERPPLGVTFHIVLGCALIAISFIVIAVTVKHKYFPKKKARKSRHVFLDDTLKKSKEQQQK